MHTLKSQDKPNAFLPNGQLEWNYRAEATTLVVITSFLKTDSYIREDLFPPPIKKFDFNSDTTSTLNYLRYIVKQCHFSRHSFNYRHCPHHMLDYWKHINY